MSELSKRYSSCHPQCVSRPSTRLLDCEQGLWSLCSVYRSNFSLHREYKEQDNKALFIHYRERTHVKLKPWIERNRTLYFSLMFTYSDKERMGTTCTCRRWGRGRGRWRGGGAGENPKHPTAEPGWGSIPWTRRSWPPLKSRAGH